MGELITNSLIKESTELIPPSVETPSYIMRIVYFISFPVLASRLVSIRQSQKSPLPT